MENIYKLTESRKAPFIKSSPNSMDSNESSPNLQIEFHIFKGFSTSSSVLRNGSNPDCIFPRECGKFHSTNCLCRVYYTIRCMSPVARELGIGFEWGWAELRHTWGVCVWLKWKRTRNQIYIKNEFDVTRNAIFLYIAAHDPVRKPRSYKARESYRTAAPINRARLHYIVHSREPQRLPYLVNEIIFCKYRFQQFV